MPEQGKSTNRRSGTRSVNRGSGRLSRPAENYLLSLSILKEDGFSPNISQLASYLRHIPPEEEVGTTMASVSGMVHRMEQDGLLLVGQEKEILLTTDGERRARDIVRRHRLSERLMVDMLGVPIERAESEAHQLEHSISPLLLEHIEKKLGYPETCPYGRPIYRADEVGPRKEADGIIRLSDGTTGLGYVITRIPDEDYPLLSFLVNNRILPGRRISVAENAPYRGVVDITIGDEKISLGMDVASRIKVAPAEPIDIAR